MYNAIASNRRRTLALMFLVSLLVCAVGWAYGVYQGDAYGGLILAGIVSLGLNVGSYFWSDRLALASTRILVGAHLQRARLGEKLRSGEQQKRRDSVRKRGTK